jgi:hypothetical protein
VTGFKAVAGSQWSVASQKAPASSSRCWGVFRAVVVVGLVGSVAWGLVGCGGAFFSTGFQPVFPRNTIFTVDGFVSVIQFTTIFDGRGAVISVTIVTFEDDFGGFSTVTFCGTLNQFFLDAFTVVDFTQGPACATPLNVTVSV